MRYPQLPAIKHPRKNTVSAAPCYKINQKNTISAPPCYKIHQKNTISAAPCYKIRKKNAVSAACCYRIPKKKHGIRCPSVCVSDSPGNAAVNSVSAIRNPLLVTCSFPGLDEAPHTQYRGKIRHP
eukprot:1222608-Karenia_brevis.AAC.1